MTPTQHKAIEDMLSYLKSLQVELRRRSIELVTNRGVTRV